MVQLNETMKIAALLLLVCIIPAFGSAEKQIGSQLDEPEQEKILPIPSITRPLRQKVIKHPYAGKPHREAPNLLTLSGLDEPLTQKFIEQFASKSGKNLLAAIVQRSGPYLAFIRKEIERRGMPQELIYLPIIESAYSADAVSRSGAMGLWQFMSISIGPHDMKITEWLDERRDFWKSTIGALDKLESEYKRVGSWELALAAYNAGIGTVLNALKKHPDADYWELCRLKAFKNETINYIPKLVAVAWVLSNPRLYGLEVEWPEDPNWTRIPVGRPVDLALVAEHADIKDFDLKKANSELTYGITPPDPSYHIKVPAQYASIITSVLEDPELNLIKYYIHTIRSGDTIWGITRQYGITENQLYSSNPGIKNKTIHIGQKLIIPALKDIKGAAIAENFVPKEENPQTVQKEVSPSPPQQTALSVSYTGTHLVKRGETLWSISRAYNIRPEVLAEINGMGLNDVLRVGSSLKTPAAQ